VPPQPESKSRQQLQCNWLQRSSRNWPLEPTPSGITLGVSSKNSLVGRIWSYTAGGCSIHLLLPSNSPQPHSATTPLSKTALPPHSTAVRNRSSALPIFVDCMNTLARHGYRPLTNLHKSVYLPSFKRRRKRRQKHANKAGRTCP